jgi:hypothetical protein
MRCTAKYADTLVAAVTLVRDELDLIPRERYPLVEHYCGEYPEISPHHVLAAMQGASVEQLLDGIDIVYRGAHNPFQFHHLKDNEDWQGGLRFNPSGVPPYYYEYESGGTAVLGGIRGSPGAVLKVTNRDEDGVSIVLARAWPNWTDAANLARRLEGVLFTGARADELAWAGITSILIPNDQERKK